MDNKSKIDGIINSITHFNYQEMSVSDIPKIVIEVMQIVEKIKGISGIEKKQLVVEIVTKMVDDSDLAGNSEKFILPLIPSLIDKLIEVDNGHLQINTSFKQNLIKLFNKIKQLFKSCACCHNCGTKCVKKQK